MDNQDYVVPSDQQKLLEDMLDNLQVPCSRIGLHEDCKERNPQMEIPHATHLTTGQVQLVSEFLSTKVKVLV